MARLRKAGKILNQPDAAARARLLAEGEGSYFTIQPDSLFSRSAPLEVEIGAGRGDFVIARACAAPQVNFLAIELAATFARLIAMQAAKAKLENLYVVRMDARSLVNLFLPDRSVSAYHIYFPDPWPKARHAKHRLFTSHLVRNLRRTLMAGAPLFVATDVRDYAAVIFAMAEAEGFRATAQPVPGVTETAFARKFTAAGRAVYARAFIG